MSRNYPDRVLYIAVHEDIFTNIFEEEPLGKLIFGRLQNSSHRFQSKAGGYSPMDTLEQYRQIICSIITEHTKIPYSYGDIQHETIFDKEQD